jgi:hypothetical protein
MLIKTREIHSVKIWLGIDSQRERAETGLHQSPMKSQLRNQNRTGDMTEIPSRNVMRYPEGDSPGANVNGYVESNSLLTSGRTGAAPANIGSTSASSGIGIETSSQGYFVKHCVR